MALEDLDRMILDSPYCANLRFLKAKKLQLSGQTEDMEPFYKAAMYSFDKHRLYDRLINSEVERELFRLEYLSHGLYQQ